jgi:LacI family transcriptional regulator
MFVGDRVAGMILAPIQDTYDVFQNIRILRDLQARRIPFVLIDRYIEDIEADHVVTNNEQAAFELTSHLVENGSRRIAFFTEPVCSSNEDRLRGYRKVLIDNGLDFDRELIFISDQRAKKAGTDLAHRLLEKQIPCDAIFCANDWVAYGAMEYLIEHGVRIPEDIAVTGFDDLSIANQTQVSLTTMHQPAEEIGRTAAMLLMDRLVNPATAIRREVLPSRMVVRASSGEPTKINTPN